uniref:Phage Tail Collar Domain n=1 Tax=Candidatus Kentrum sp. TUN TaxID=2126343 RepID=A0A450ZUR5_9GAMM|nr:MAG: hypothetical protein BECKTUN1418F_GA0071002_11184 [Candidatus Kentron sp. TUN]VFK65933.1 MAG: hypothetical protein BECKTUN1418E_GA0071001_11174 [Candidatus Kentron sp. TUN]
MPNSTLPTPDPFSLLSSANMPLDFCDGRLEQSIKETYNLESLDRYRAILRKILNHPHDVLQRYVDDGGEGLEIPLPIAADVLRAENADAETRRLLDGLRSKYSPSPELALLDPDFEALAARVLPSNIAAGWQGCEVTCDECRANVGNLRNGVHYRILGRENQLFGIIFTYLPSQESDPVSVVITEVEITGGTLEAPVVLDRGKALHRYASHTQTIKRTEPDTEVTLRIDLEDREGLQLRISNRIPEKGPPVGTIFPSILAWPQYAVVAGDRTGFDAGKNYWSPCDGRGIPGSRLADLTGNPNAPDLRGMFLRGLNQFDPEEPGPAAEDRKDPDSGRKAGSFQGHNVGGHEHIYRGGSAEGIANANRGGDIDRVWWSGDDTQSWERKTENNPSGEARPANIAVHYYVKIN